MPSALSSSSGRFRGSGCAGRASAKSGGRFAGGSRGESPSSGWPRPTPTVPTSKALRRNGTCSRGSAGSRSPASGATEQCSRACGTRSYPSSARPSRRGAPAARRARSPTRSCSPPQKRASGFTSSRRTWIPCCSDRLAVLAPQTAVFERARTEVSGQVAQTALLVAGSPSPLEFLRHDVRDGATGGPFDLVLCRNLVFTYFGDELQREVGRHLASSLRAGGALVLGWHEALPEGLDRLEPWPAARGAYRYRREQRAREPTNGEDRRL